MNGVDDIRELTVEETIKTLLTDAKNTLQHQLLMKKYWQKESARVKKDKEAKEKVVAQLSGIGLKIEAQRKLIKFLEEELCDISS
jgi:hypothetical protein